jgi:hypothetical protein
MTNDSEQFGESVYTVVDGKLVKKEQEDADFEEELNFNA